MADLLRVSIAGAMPSGEEWSVNPVYSIGGDFGAPVSAAQCNTIATAIAALAVSTFLVTMWAPGTNMSNYRVEARALDGTLESQAEAVEATPINGTGTAIHPYQTSVVTSLRTTTAGASGRGRLYWPATGVVLDSTNYRLSPTSVTNHLGAVKSFLTGIQGAIDVTLDGVALAVWSRKLEALYVVNQIQMGNVVDTQRRRRDNLIENYTGLSYP